MNIILKTLFLLLFLNFGFTQLQAQGLADEVNQIFSGLDLTSLETNLLLDKGLGRKSWVIFDGSEDIPDS